MAPRCFDKRTTSVEEDLYEGIVDMAKVCKCFDKQTAKVYENMCGERQYLIWTCGTCGKSAGALSDAERTIFNTGWSACFDRYKGKLNTLQRYRDMLCEIKNLQF